MLTPEILEARKKGLGGSDIAVILGLSPWKTPTELYLEKRGELEPEDISDKEIIHFGHVLEDVVAQEYARRNDVKVERRNKMITHPDHEFMLANIDRKVVGEKKGLECKTADRFTMHKWGEQGSEDIPDYYRTQVEWYMQVTGYPEWDLAVLIGGNTYRDYHIEADKELQEVIYEHAAKFWDRVKRGIAPDFDFDHPGTLDLIKKMYPGTNGETIQLPNELVHWAEVKQEAERIVKEYGTVVDVCKGRILAAIGEAACGTLPDAGVQFKRSLVKATEFTVKKDAYMVMRQSKYTPK
ncbi:MAG: YqaJ viral recombinase family protein [Gammaproteobacteria bacterium]|nr:YqaJ viral recombinase family protein [Gammaproteobacteria bacterium]